MADDASMKAVRDHTDAAAAHHSAAIQYERDPDSANKYSDAAHKLGESAIKAHEKDRSFKEPLMNLALAGHSIEVPDDAAAHHHIMSAVHHALSDVHAADALSGDDDDEGSEYDSKGKY